MSQTTMDCQGQETVDSDAVASARMRYDLIVRARQEIRAGLYDDDARIEQMLAGCMDAIVDDTQSAKA